jgi:hypothetical protein
VNLGLEIRSSVFLHPPNNCTTVLKYFNNNDNYSNSMLLLCFVYVLPILVVWQHTTGQTRAFTTVNSLFCSQGSSISIVCDSGLDDRGSIPDRGRGFFL